MAVAIKELCNLKGHNDKITSIFVPDSGISPTFYTSSRDKKVYQWKFKDEDTVAYVTKAYEKSRHYVNDIVVTNSQQLISGGSDNIVRIYDSDNEECIELREHTNSVSAVTINTNENKIVTGGWDGKICLWNTEGEKIKTYDRSNNGHKGWITCLSFIPRRNNLLVSGGEDGLVKVWDIETGVVIDTYANGCKITKTDEEISPVKCLSLSPDGRFCAYASKDGNAYVLNLNDNKQVLEYQFKGSVVACAFGLVDTIIVFATAEEVVFLEIFSKEPLCSFDLKSEANNTLFTSLAWHNHHLLVGLNNGNVKVLEYLKEDN